MAATINWSTAAELLAADGPAEATVEEPVDADVQALLVDAFPEVRQALDPDALDLEDFETFGPVQHFRDLFIAGWGAVLEMIAEARQEVSVRA
jgi:hypothetical protein